MTRSQEERLADVASAIERCQQYRAYLDSADLGSMAYDAVLRNLAVIGEATKALPAEFKEVRPDVPWSSIAGLRHIVVHEYFRVDQGLVRDIVDGPLVEPADVVRESLGD